MARRFHRLKRSAGGQGEIVPFDQQSGLQQGWQPGSPLPAGAAPDLTPPPMGTHGNVQNVPIPGVNATWAQRQQNPANLTQIPGWGKTTTNRPGAGISGAATDDLTAGGAGITNPAAQPTQYGGAQPAPNISTPPPPGSDPQTIIAWQMRMRRAFGPGGGQRVGGGYGPGGNVPDQGGSDA